jgi:hypothetical protein
VTSRVCHALSALVLFVAAASLLPGAASAAAARSDSRPVEVGITQVSPQVPDFTDTSKRMTFSGVVHNAGSTTLKGVRLEIRRSTVINRSAMGSADGDGDYVDLPKAQTKLPDELAPNSSASWKLIPTEKELFGYLNPSAVAAGVYAIDVDVADSDGHFLGGQRTYVVWNPAQQKNAKPARIALMWPVVGQPGLTGQKKPDHAALPIIPNQSVAQQFAQDGRLTRILKDASGLSVNWLLDPDVLYTAQELSGGYFYPDPLNSGKQIGAQGIEPETWYALANEVLSTPQATQNCWNLLYGDPDLNTLSHTKAGPDLLKTAARVRPPASIRGCPASGPAIAWPSTGQADATTLSAIAGADAPNTVTLVGSNAVSGWPSAHASLPSSPNTVVYDNYLSALFAAPAKTAQSALSSADVLAGQMWLAQTALADKDNTSRVLVVTPPRDFDPGPQLLGAIKASTSVPTKAQWFGLDSLSQVLNVPPTPERLSALTKITTPNLSSTVVDDAWDSQQLYHALHAIMPANDEHDADVPFRPTATWWRNHDGGQAYGKSVYDTVVAAHALVSFASQTPPLTMSGKSGTVPVAIRNQTDATIRVYLGTKTSQTLQLKVGQNQGPQTVPRGQSATVRIPVKGAGNGNQILLTAKLYTCPDVTDDCAYYPSNLITKLKQDGGQTMVTVEVSRIGIIALALIIGSGMLLVLLIGLRVYRAKRTHHSPAPAQDTMAS